MDEWKVIGYQNVDYVARDGKQVKGLRLFLTAPANPERDSFGEICCAEYISGRVDYTPMIGDTIRIFYNRYGKAQSIETC